MRLVYLFMKKGKEDERKKSALQWEKLDYKPGSLASPPKSARAMALFTSS